jgi:ATP-binding cassette subfamily B protein
MPSRTVNAGSGLAAPPEGPLDPTVGPSGIPVTLSGQLRRHLRTFVHGSVYLLAFNGLRAAIDLVLKRGVDDLHDSRFEDASRVGLLLVGMTVVAVIVRIASRVVLFNGGRDVEYELRSELLAKLHTLGPAFFRKMPVGEVMSRTTNDLAQVRLLFGFGALNVVNTTFAFVSALGIMIGLSPRLTLAAILVYPPLIYFTRSFSKAMFLRTREAQDALGKLADRVQTNLAGVRVVRSFALEEDQIRLFEEGNRDYLAKSLAIARIRGSMGPVMGMLGTMGTFVVFWYGGRLVVSGELSPGAFVAFLSALGRLAWPIMALGFMLAIVQRGRASFARLAEIFAETPEVRSGSHAAPAAIEGRLSVRGLSFAFRASGGGERKILDDVSFEVPAGRSLAIVGRTGAGKSTLAALLPRLLPVARGSVFLDGIDVCDLPLETVRRAIGYAQQDAFLFSTTVGRNVGFPLDDPDDPAAIAKESHALSEAFVLEEVQRFDAGLETVVGERGVQLSGGQRQRIALARALLREPPVLVLDDPLSAVDAKTEAAILEAIERQTAARTVVLITHRVAAASRCDEIIVLDAGRIVERGDHEALVARGGLYAAFAKEQAVATELDDLASAEVEPAATSPAPNSPTPNSPIPNSGDGGAPNRLLDPAEGCT